MKNGVECYKDFFPYFKALKTNCAVRVLVFKTPWGSSPQKSHAITSLNQVG